jgi:hypothetical protein
MQCAINILFQRIAVQQSRNQIFFSAFLCVASTQILLFLRRFSLRPSAYLSALGGEIRLPQRLPRYAEGRREEKVWLRLCSLRISARSAVK